MSPPKRSHALDNARTTLTALVTLHHAVIPYGGLGSWPYVSPLHSSFCLPILTFLILNQSFFMAAFFLLSGYFSSAAAGKCTRWEFVWGKGKRLGAPGCVYSLFGRGVVRGVIARRTGGLEWTGIWVEFVEGVRGVRGVNGPVWYCALLLIFDALYAVLFPSHFAPSSGSERAMEVEKAEKTNQNNGKEGPKPLKTRYVLAALFITGLASFLVRMEYPVGRDFKPLGLQLAFTSQYVLYYVAGIYIHRSKHTLQDAISTRALYHVAAIVVVITTFAIFQVTPKVTSGTPFRNLVDQATGGFNIFAFTYALWNEFVGLLLCSLLLKLFTSSPLLGDRKWHILGVDVGKYSYAAFLVHTPLVVNVQCWLGKRGFEERRGDVVTAMSVGVLGMVESWGVGWVVKEGVDRVLGRGYV